MVEKLEANHFLAVVGGSGSGKSSLVNCGLRPALHRGNMTGAGSRWHMARMRPGSDPMTALARSLAEPGVLFDQPISARISNAELIESTLRLGSLGLVDITAQARLPEGTHLLVVADQFEELFRFRALVKGAGAGADAYTPAQDAVVFVQLLLAAAAQRKLPIHVVLTMRSDFLGDCTQFNGLPEAINQSQYLVPRLTRGEIRAAITGPAAVRGAKLSPALVTHLLNDVGDNPDQLSILQHTLNRTWAMWEHANSTGPLELDHYIKAGRMDCALDTHADKTFNELELPGQQALCERVFKVLTDIGNDPRGIRRPTPLEGLCNITGATADELTAVIDVFRKPSRSFLMPPIAEALGPNSPIDISHESLMRVWRRLRGWAEDEAQSARIYRRLRESAQEYENGNATLLRDPELRRMLAWRELQQPNEAWAKMVGGGFEAAEHFLDASRDQQLQEEHESYLVNRWKTRWRWFPVLLSLLTLVWLEWDLAPRMQANLISPEPGSLGARVRYGMDFILPIEKVSFAAMLLSVLLTGMPAAMGLLLFTPLVRQRFPVWDLKLSRLWRSLRGLRAKVVKKTLWGSESRHLALDLGDFRPASFIRRALAQVIDWAVCLLVAILFAVILLFVVFTTDTNPDGVTLLIAVVIAILIVCNAYHAIFWMCKRQATPGMRIVGVYVADRHGAPLTRMRAQVRFFARILSYCAIGLGFIAQLFSKQGLTWHDRIAGTVVLRGAPAAVAPVSMLGATPKLEP